VAGRHSVRGRCFTQYVRASPIVGDTAFTQTTIAVLVTLALAIVLQAKLLGAPATHPITSRARRIFAIFELYLTALLGIIGFALAYVLFRHLAGDSGPFTPADRRAFASLLVFLLTGLVLIALGNRIVAVAWNPPEREYLEPALDEDLVAGLAPAVGVAVAVAAPVVLVSDRLGIAWLVALLFGVVVVGALALASATGRRARHRAGLRFDARMQQHEYEATLVDVPLPGDADSLTVRVFEPPGRDGPRYVSIDDASRLVRHLNGAWERARRRDPYAEAPPRLRLLAARDFTLNVVARGPEVGKPESRWAARAPTGSPRGLVAWSDGADVPALPRPGGQGRIRAGPAE
jgi:hypothetical protein